MSLGQMTLRVLNGARGGAKFARALARGDIADDATIEARRAICRECPSRVRKAVLKMKSESDWCGDPLQPGMRMDPPTCGCLLAGKTAVGSETCPQGRW
jgi:hypothetical protein